MEQDKRVLLRSVATGILLGLALFTVEFLISVRFYFKDILSWGEGLRAFVGVAIGYAALGGGIGLVPPLLHRIRARGSSSRSRRPHTAWLPVWLAFHVFFALLMLIGRKHLPLPIWVYGAYLAVFDVLVLCARLVLRHLERRVPSTSGPLLWASSYGVLSGMLAFACHTQPGWEPAQSAGPATPEHPNVVLIVLDTVRADHCSVYGYHRPTTPYLESLAREATVFERALAPATWTVPSHASIFTGELPGSHGAHQEHLFLEEEADTLAERFQAAGYHTVAIVNNPFLSRRLGFSQGFASFEQGSSQLLRRHGFMVTAALARFLPEAGDHGAERSVEAVRRLVQRMDGTRFFLFVNLMEAHAPYGTLPEPSRSRFRDGPPPARFGYWMDAALPDVLIGDRTLRSDERQMLVDLYDAGIHYLDRMVERMLETLRDEGLLDRTVVVVTSDHGEHLGEYVGGRQLISHFFSLHDDLLHVPLIVRAPGPSSGRRVRETVRLQDLFGTLLDLAGLDAEPQSPSLFDRNAWSRPVVAEAYRPWFMMRRLSLVVDDARLERLDRRRRAIQRNAYKLIRVDEEPPALFDLAADPEETRDVAHERPREREALTMELERLVKDFPVREERFPGLDPVSLQGLRALGYLR